MLAFDRIRNKMIHAEIQVHFLVVDKGEQNADADTLVVTSTLTQRWHAFQSICTAIEGARGWVLQSRD